MIIYNMLKNPVILTLGDQTYRMEKDSELEVKIPAGEYFIRLHKVNRKDKPITTTYVSGGRYSRGTTYIHQGMTAFLNLKRDTKVYIREDKEEMLTIPSEYYKQFTFDVLVDNGELTHRQDGLVDIAVRKKLVRQFYGELISSIIGNLLIALGGCYMLSLLVGVIGEKGASQDDIGILILYILAPIACVGSIVLNISKFKRVDLFKNLPVLPDRSYYDYL